MMHLFNYEGMYRRERLRALDHYKYLGVDKSPISKYVLKHYWNFLANLLPLSIAPNTITLIGTCLMIFGAALALINDYTFHKQAPSWMCFLFAALTWAYSTCDNLDGKQARRTRSSSPLGELFDHGCDALVCFLGLIMQMSALALGRPDALLISKVSVLLVTWGFFVPTWEEYHTGILYLGYVNYPTEGILTFCTILMIAGLVDRGTLMYTPLLYNFPLPSIYQFFAISSLTLFIIPHAIRNVKKSTQKSHFSQIIPFVLCTIFAMNWWSNRYSLTNDPRYLIVFIGLIGFANGKYATKIIYAHLLNEPFPLFTRLSLPIFIGSLSYGSLKLIPLPIDEGHFLYTSLLIVSFSYFLWTYHCVNSISQYLGIHCFSLKKRK